MNLLDAILKSAGGGPVRQLANQFGLSEDQTASAVESLVPALSGGLQRNISQGGLPDLLGALTKGRHERYLDDPAALSSEAVREDGNGILGHILGNKDVSRKVAAEAATKTGLSESTLKQMLPSIAALAMGALSKQASASPAASMASGGDTGILGMLTPLLDRNKDGSATDDILGSVSKFFQK